MTKQCGTEVDVLSDMDCTFPVSHLEMSALKAPADRNTTHHPKRQKQWAPKGGGQEGMQKQQTARGELKKKSKQQISDTVQ